MKTKLWLLGLLILGSAGGAYAQGVRFSSTVTQQGTIGTSTNAVILPANPVVTFCNHPANAVPCTNKATTYTDQTLATPCSTSTQIVRDGTMTCVASPDAQNNWGVWVAPNTLGYDYTITLTGGVNLGPFNVLSQTTTLSSITGPLTVNGGLTSSGVTTLKDINHQKLIDGTTYPLTGAGFQQAVTDCIADAACSLVDASQLGAVTTTTTTSDTKGIRVIFGLSTQITGTSDPVYCYSSSSSLIGDSGNPSSGLPAIRSSVAASRVAAPCTPASNTFAFYNRGVNLWNTSASATATVLDMTNANNSRLDNASVLISGGSATNILVTITGAGSAFYNNFWGVKVLGSGGTGSGYVFSNGANENVISGGKIDSVGNCITFGGGASQTNNINVFGTACESQTGVAINAPGPATMLKWFGGRFESNGASATLFNIAASGVSNIYVYGPQVAGTQTIGTTNGLVSIYGYNQGTPLIANGLEMATVAGIQAPKFLATTTGSTFTGGTAGDALILSANGPSSGFGLQLQNSFAGGHNWRVAELQGNGHLNFRDLTATGSPFWGLQVLGSTAAEGLFTHSITANRAWAMPDASGTVPLLSLAQSWTAAQTIGAGGSINFASLLESPTAPTIAAAGCGGGAASISNNNGTAAFEVNVGTTPGSACTITMPAAAHRWVCTAVDFTTNSTSVFYQKQSPIASQTTTQIVITNFSDVAAATAFVASDIMGVSCHAY